MTKINSFDISFIENENGKVFDLSFKTCIELLSPRRKIKKKCDH